MDLKVVCESLTVKLCFSESDDGSGKGPKPDFYRHCGGRSRQPSACDDLMRNSDSVREQIVPERHGLFAMFADDSRFVRKTREGSRTR